MDDVSSAVSRLPPAFTTGDANAAGITRHVLRRLLRSGDVVQVHRGLFRLPPVVEPGDPDWTAIRSEYLVRTRAALAAHPAHAASHETAAVLHGWPILLQPRSLVHLTAVDVAPRSRREPGVVLHHSDSLRNDAVVRDGLPVISPVRSVADCLRTMYPAKAVAVLDASLRQGDVTLADVRDMVDRQRRWRGRPTALSSLGLADARRETWLESYSFVELTGFGIPLPTPQVEIYDPDGRLVARGDGMWVPDGTVAEADGQAKYTLASAGFVAGSEAAAVQRVLSEKSREDDIRDLGLEVVRWDTAQVRQRPDQVAQRVQRARARGSLDRFTGHLRVDGHWLTPPPTGHALRRVYDLSPG